jgi:hypothetical protein
MYDQRVRPSRLWLWLAGVLLAGALACIALSIVGFISVGHQIDSFQRVKVPGHGDVTFSAAGNYLLYFEGPGMNRGGTGTVRVLLQSASDGSRVPITSQHPSEKYSLGGHSGQAVASFTITRPGRYLLTSGVPTSPAPADIAIGRDIGASIVRPVILLVFGVLALAGGVVLGVLTAARRRWRLRAQSGMAQQFQPYAMPPVGQQPTPGGPMPPSGGPGMPPY